jgi:hypothetical protein
MATSKIMTILVSLISCITQGSKTITLSISLTFTKHLSHLQKKSPTLAQLYPIYRANTPDLLLLCEPTLRHSKASLQA